MLRRGMQADLAAPVPGAAPCATARLPDARKAPRAPQSRAALSAAGAETS